VKNPLDSGSGAVPPPAARDVVADYRIQARAAEIWSDAAVWR